MQELYLVGEGERSCFFVSFLALCEREWMEGG